MDNQLENSLSVFWYVNLVNKVKHGVYSNPMNYHNFPPCYYGDDNTSNFLLSIIATVWRDLPFVGPGNVPTFQTRGMKGQPQVVFVLSRDISFQSLIGFLQQYIRLWKTALV